MAKNAFAIIGILAVLLLSLGLVSAAPNDGNLKMVLISTPLNVTDSDTSLEIIFNLTNTGLSHDISDLDHNLSTGSWVWNETFPKTLAADEVIVIKGTLTFPTQLAGSIIDSTINSTSGALVPGQISISIPVIETPTTPTPEPYEFCNWNGTAGFTNGTELIIKGFSDEQLDNKDEWEWKPLDEIEIEVNIKNDGEYDEDYIVEIIFLDSDGNEADIAEDDKDLEEEVSIDEGDKETVTFNFVVDGDVDEKENYYMHIKVYQENDEDEQCISLIESKIERIDITKERHDVIIKRVEGPNTVEAGTQVLYEVRVANLGREDEEMVKIIVSNSELGILMIKEIEDLDEGDLEVITFSITFPDEATEKMYKIRFSTEFDYDEDDEIYDKVSDSKDDIKYQVTVLGGEHIAPTISASLESEAKVGEELVIVATIINNGKDGSFDISISGYESWAELVSISPQSLSLDEDEEGTVIITLIPSEEGFQTFDIDATADGESYDQAVSVNITEEEKGLFADISKTVLYTVAGIVALIILIFLTLIVKVSRRAKKEVPQF